LKVPYDVSVIGFDDIKVAAFNNPRLTTIRQPLSNMGRIAAQCVLSQLNGSGPFRKLIMVEPELAVRESTSAIDQAARSDNRKKSSLCLVASVTQTLRQRSSHPMPLLRLLHEPGHLVSMWME